MMIVSIGLVRQAWQAGQLGARLWQHRANSAVSRRADARGKRLPGYEAGSWYGLAAPKGTPREIVTKLNAETQRIFNDPAFREKFLAPSFIFSVVSSPEEFAERIRTESAKWGKVIKDANVKVE
jgi:tripartite-type tricarboxylate transporter receptor subunit TctC